MSIALRHRIFVSAVTSEFGNERAIVATALRALGYEPEYQDEFMTESGDLREILRNKIDSCSGLVQIVGKTYGFEPPTLDTDFGRVSYTQYELLYARQKGKKVWLFLPTEIIQSLEQVSSPEEKLQAEYVGSLMKSRFIWHSFESESDLKEKLFKLRNDLESIRSSFARWQWGVLVAIGSIGVLLAGLTFLLQSGQNAQQKQLEKLSTTIKQEIGSKQAIDTATEKTSSSEMKFSLLRPFGEPEVETNRIVCDFPSFEPAVLTISPNEILSSFDLALEATIVNSTTQPIIIDRIGIRIIRGGELNSMPFGDWQPFRVKVSDSFDLEMPDVYTGLSNELGFSLTPALFSYLAEKNVNTNKLAKLRSVKDWQTEFLSGKWMMLETLRNIANQLKRDGDPDTVTNTLSDESKWLLENDVETRANVDLLLTTYRETKTAKEKRDYLNLTLVDLKKFFAEHHSKAGYIKSAKMILNTPGGYRGKEPFLFQEFLSRYIPNELMDEPATEEGSPMKLPSYFTLGTNIIELDRLVTTQIDDPVFVPAAAPYRFRIKASSFGEKMPNVSQIRIVLGCGEKTFESPIINVAFFIVRGADDVVEE